MGFHFSSIRYTAEGSQESQLGITQLEDILERLVMLQGQGGRVGASLTEDYQPPGTPKGCTLGRRLQSRILPFILSSKFSRTTHVGVVFLIHLCLIGSEISYVKNNFKTFFHETSHSLVLLLNVVISGCRTHSGCAHTSSQAHTSSWAQKGAVGLLH